MDIYESRIDGVGDFMEFVPGGEAEQIVRTVEVPEGATAFAIGVGDVEGRQFSIPPDARLALRYVGDRGPQRGVNETIDVPTESSLVLNQGVVAYVNTRPTPGRWELKIEHSGRSVFSVNVSVFVRPLRSLRAFTAKHRCKACKVAVRTVLYAVFAKLTAGVIAVFDLGDLVTRLMEAPRAIREFLTNSLGMGVDQLSPVLRTVRDILEIETPLERLVRKICEALGLCPVQPRVTA